MILKKGNLFADFYDKKDVMYLATGNSVIKHDNRLVMGGGSAKELLEYCTNIDFDFAKIIGKRYSYYFIPHNYLVQTYFDEYSSIYVGLFQTKTHWKDPSDTNLINVSTNYLYRYATVYRPDLTYRLPFPGIGLGQLKREDVLPLIEVLPDNVEVWEKE